VRFRRPPGMLPLPMPQPGGSLEELTSLVNLPDRENLVLVTTWLLATIRHRGPYPLLVIAGEQGSVKTVLSKMLRALVDPNAAPVYEARGYCQHRQQRPYRAVNGTRSGSGPLQGSASTACDDTIALISIAIDSWAERHVPAHDR